MNKKKSYELLGVDKTTSEDDIKKAFRNKAKKYHPDKNKSVDANERFKAIREAYEVLLNVGKRKDNVAICDNCGEIIKLSTEQKENTNKTLNRHWLLIVIVSIQIVGVVFLAFFYRNILADKTDEEVDVLVNENIKLKAEMTDILAEIKTFLSSQDAGIASSDFFSSEKVIFVSESNPAFFNITAKFPKPYTLEWDYDDNFFEISTNDIWENDKLTLKITPITNGIDYISFKNTQNSQNFRILVIVTE